MVNTRTRQLAVVAQDPGVRDADGIVVDRVRLPFEDLDPGPMGHRVHVVDYDASSGTLYRPAVLKDTGLGDGERPADDVILGDPAFHAQNVYALVMRTLGRFESALGRRVEWGFRAHRLKVVPHAFDLANAYYSRRDEALLFGWFRRAGEPVFTCLSHDIVVHETTHALVDGLRPGFMRPSSPDQAAFHEGFADVVALLSVFGTGAVLQSLLARSAGPDAPAGLIATATLDRKTLRRSVLLGLAEEMDPVRPGAGALRRSVELQPDPGLLKSEEYDEPHRRGEVLVAAVMSAFLEVWLRRLHLLGAGEWTPVERAADEGAQVAAQLLTAAIRALDYCPPIHLEFREFLAAVLTADSEVRDDDSRFELRAALRESCAGYGIVPPPSCDAEGRWVRSDLALTREGVRFGSLRTDPTEMYRLIWANRRKLGLGGQAFTRVTSVRPCLRTGPEDGQPVQETVAECLQYLRVRADELGDFGLTMPAGMPADLDVVIEGGSTLVLDEYGVLKFRVHHSVPRKGDAASAQRRLEYLWKHGYLDPRASIADDLPGLHQQRLLGAGAGDPAERW